MRSLSIGVACVVVGLACTAARGFTFDQVVVEQWAGPETADNETLCVVDFDDVSYAFGYRWNNGDTFTRPTSDFSAWAGETDDAGLSEAMLLALAELPGLTIESSYDAAYGYQLGSISYGGHSLANNWLTSYAAFWMGGSEAWTEDVWAEVPPGSGQWRIVDIIEHPPAPTSGENWAASGFGASQRWLADGFWDAWTLEQVVDGYPPVNTPMVPIITTPGDVDANGLVDLNDFQVLKDNFATPGLWANGDFNQDRIVNLADFVLLKNNFTGSTSIPEPASIILLTGGAAALFARRRGR